MGRGGDGSKMKKPMDSMEKVYKLSDLSTDDLKKWCQQYGIKCDGDRVKMLKELVRYILGDIRHL